MISIVVLIFNFLGTCYVEHPFICVFAINITSLVRRLFRSFVHFLIVLSTFLLLNFISSYIFLNNSPSLDISSANIFSQILAYLLIP